MHVVGGLSEVGGALTSSVIGCAIEVHRHLGPGLLESIYEECLIKELNKLGLNYKRQLVVPVIYKGEQIEQTFKLDLMVEDKVVIELKAVDKVTPLHEAQLLTYLKLTKCELGLIINFNEKLLKDGLRRIVLSHSA